MVHKKSGGPRGDNLAWEKTLRVVSPQEQVRKNSNAADYRGGGVTHSIVTDEKKN